MPSTARVLGVALLLGARRATGGRGLGVSDSEFSGVDIKRNNSGIRFGVNSDARVYRVDVGVIGTSGDFVAEGDLAAQSVDVAADLSVAGDAVVEGGITVQTVDVTGDFNVAGNALVKGDITVVNVDASGDLSLAGDAVVEGDIAVVNVDVAGDLNVAGDGVVEGDITAVNVDVSGDLSLAGDALVEGDIAVQNVDVAGDLTVAGDAVFKGGITMEGVGVTGDVSVAGDAVVQSVDVRRAGLGLGYTSKAWDFTYPGVKNYFRTAKDFTLPLHWTIEMWVYPLATTGNVLQFSTTNNLDCLLLQATNLVVGKWHHIVISYDRRAVYVLDNGAVADKLLKQDTYQFCGEYTGSLLLGQYVVIDYLFWTDARAHARTHPHRRTLHAHPNTLYITQHSNALVPRTHG